jgi:hypothetical protein
MVAEFVRIRSLPRTSEFSRIRLRKCFTALGQGAKLTADKQDRLDTLMDTNNQGKLSRKRQRGLQDLVRETQEITLHNARVLAEQQRRLQQD